MHFGIAVSLLFLVACAQQASAPMPPRSQLDIRQSQTREYETKDSKMVVKAVLNVLQDEGFIVKNAVVELGLLTATKEESVQPLPGSSSGWEGPLASVIIGGSMAMVGRLGGGFSFGRGPGYDSRREPSSKHAIIEASANVSEFGKVTRVRVNFARKTVDNLGGTLEVVQIEDPKFYQEFFSKVDKGVFIQREKL